VDSLVNRYGLPAVLGLGYSFIRKSMCAAVAPVAATLVEAASAAFPADFNPKKIKQEAQLIANFPEDRMHVSLIAIEYCLRVER
jgi:hypothetical protein